MNYSWYLPKTTYVIRAAYDRPSRVSIERISGDLRTLRGSWELKSDGGYTMRTIWSTWRRVSWVPHWMVRSALRKDLPKCSVRCALVLKPRQTPNPKTAAWVAGRC